MAERFEEAAQSLKNVKKVRIISHYDADGIFSAAILSRSLSRKGIHFHITLAKSLDEAIIGRLNEEVNPAIIICDIGSGEIEKAETLESKVLILDHHQTRKESSQVMQINPHLFDMNGADVLCGSLLCFLFAIAMDEENWNLVPLALAGGIADKQHLGGLKGANAKILEEAVERGEVKVTRGLLLEGKLKNAISSSIEPYFSMDEENLINLLAELNIDPSTKIEDMDPRERGHLTSILTLRLLEQGIRSEAIDNLMGDIYWAEKMNISANSLADDVNACGRMKEEILGIELCYGDKEALSKVKKLRTEYEGKIMTNLRKLKADGSFKKPHIQFFYSDEPRIAGALAGIAMQYFLDQEKATFALVALEKKTKVSCRATKNLVARGLNLAAACRNAASQVGGSGGGHTIASGAFIPKGKEEKFLELADSIIGSQYANHES